MLAKIMSLFRVFTSYFYKRKLEHCDQLIEEFTQLTNI